MDIVEVQEMIRRMQIIHWVVMGINLTFCLSVMVLAKRSVGRVRREHDLICERIRRERWVEINRLCGIISTQEDTICDHKEQVADCDATIENLRAEREEAAKRILSLEDSITQYQSEVAERIDSYRVKCGELESRDMDVAALQSRIKKSDAAYETLRMEYDQLHAAHKLLKNDRDMTTRELTAMTLERDRLLEVIKLRDEKIDKLVARTNELNSQINGLKYSIKTRGGQVPDLNTAWHMKETPVSVKQKYLLDDTPLDGNGSGVIDSPPYGE